MNIFFDLKDYVLSQKCKVHPNYLCDKIYLNQNTKGRRICDKCLKENKYLSEEILYIRDLIDTDENTLIETYPPLRDHSLLPRLASYKIELVSIEIDALFDEMIKTFQITLENKKKQVKEFLIKRNDIQQKINDTYKEVANLDTLKKALFTQSTDLDGQLEQVIQQAFINAENNTQKIEQLLFDISDNSEMLQIEEARSKMKEITQIINSLNFFDSSKLVDLLPRSSLIKTTMGYSQLAQITKIPQNYLVFANESDQRLNSQVCLDFILEPSANYLVQIEFQQEQNQDKYFTFGIMPDSKKNNIWVPGNKLCYYDKLNDCGVNKLLKGSSIVNKNGYERRSLECRINLQRRFFRVGTLPNYTSVVEVENPNLINPAESYRFTLAGLESKTKMIIKKLQKVKSFNELM